MKRSFTLIELLSVIFIIALLMGIMFPAFGLVRNLMLKMACQNTIGELGKAAIDCSLSQTYNGNFPGPAMNKNIFSQWDYQLASQMNLAICTDPEDQDAIIEANKFFTCKKDPILIDVEETKAMRSYGLNLGSNEIRPTLASIDQANIRSPAETVLLVEFPLEKSALLTKNGNYAHTIETLTAFLDKPQSPGVHSRTDGEPELSVVFYDGSTSTIKKRKGESFKQSPDYRLFLYDKRK